MNENTVLLVFTIIMLIVMVGGMFIGLPLFLIFSANSSKSIKRLRSCKCIFTNEDFEIVSKKNEGYRKKDKEYYTFGIRDGVLTANKDTKVVKGEYVKGNRYHTVKSKQFGYTIKRTEHFSTVFLKDSTGESVPVEETRVTFSIENYGNILSKSQKRRLNGAVGSAGYTHRKWPLGSSSPNLSEDFSTLDMYDSYYPN